MKKMFCVLIGIYLLINSVVTFLKFKCILEINSLNLPPPRLLNVLNRIYNFNNFLNNLTNTGVTSAKPNDMNSKSLLSLILVAMAVSAVPKFDEG